MLFLAVFLFVRYPMALLAVGGWLVAGGIVYSQYSRKREEAFVECPIAHPSLVVLSITPYGLTGPWSDRLATEFTLQAESGSIASRGLSSQAPFMAGGRITDWQGNKKKTGDNAWRAERIVEVVSLEHMKAEGQVDEMVTDLAGTRESLKECEDQLSDAQAATAEGEETIAAKGQEIKAPSGAAGSMVTTTGAADHPGGPPEAAAHAGDLDVAGGARVCRPAGPGPRSTRRLAPGGLCRGALTRNARDRDDAAQCLDGLGFELVAEARVVEEGLHQVLAVVERPFDRDVVDVGGSDGGHLAALDLRDPPLRMEDQDGHGRAAGACLDRSGDGRRNEAHWRSCWHGRR